MLITTRNSAPVEPELLALALEFAIAGLPEGVGATESNRAQTSYANQRCYLQQQENYPATFESNPSHVADIRKAN